MQAPDLNGAGGERIESWKQIAAYFGRDERTVKRWERERGLPIHRMPGSRGGVFAYSRELSAWLNSGDSESSPKKEEPAEEPEAAIEASGAAPARPVRYWTAHPRKIGIMGLVVLALLVVAATRPSMHSRLTAAVRGRSVESDASEAREFYLQGRYYWNRRTEDSLRRAADAYTQAIVRDPSYAPAYAGLAETYDLIPQFTATPMSEALPRAIAAARKAIALDPSLAQAHRALGWALFFGPWDVNGALAEYKRAVDLDPQSADSHHWYGNALLAVGRLPEARTEMEAARRLDPGSRAIQMDFASIQYWSGDRQGAVDRMLTVERLEPDFLAPPRYLMGVFFDQGDFGQYITQFKLAATISHDATALSMAEAAERGWRTGGERGMLLALYTRQKELFDQGRTTGFDLAKTCARLDRPHEASLYLIEAMNRKDAGPMGIFTGVFHDRLKDDPEFQHVEDLVEARTGYPFRSAFTKQP